MKPVIVQTLIKSMKNRVRLSGPGTDPNLGPTRKDQAAGFVIAAVVIAIIVSLLV